MDSIRFKILNYRINGKNRLMTLDELIALPTRHKTGKIAVVDLKSQKNYITGYVTILRKFK